MLVFGLLESRQLNLFLLDDLRDGTGLEVNDKAVVVIFIIVIVRVWLGPHGAGNTAIKLVDLA